MSDDDIYYENILVDKIKIKPKFLNKNYKNYIVTNLKKKYEGLYTKYGMIKKDSIKLLNISLGSIEQNSFEGNILYIVEFSSLVCKPVIGDIILCNAQNVNNFGILCMDNKYSIIEVIIPKKSIAIQSDIDINDIKINENIYVEILGIKTELNDTKIKCIGKIKKTTNISSKKNNTFEKNDKIIFNELDDDNLDNLDDIVDNRLIGGNFDTISNVSSSSSGDDDDLSSDDDDINKLEEIIISDDDDDDDESDKSVTSDNDE